MISANDEKRRADFDGMLRTVPAKDNMPPRESSVNTLTLNDQAGAAVSGRRGRDFDQFVKNVLDEDELYEVKTRARLVSSIVKRRCELGITQEQLAKMTGIKQSAIARLESQGCFPRIDTLCKIIKPLGLTLQFTIN